MRKNLPKEKQPLPPLSDRDRDQFLAALDRPARPIPEAIRKAKKRHEELIVSDKPES